MVTVACFCRRSIDAPPCAVTSWDYHVVTCPQCKQPWAICTFDGALAAQVRIDPRMSFERVVHRLRLYSVRVRLSDWESPEVRGAFAAVWAARMRWEFEDPWGRWITRALGWPLFRLLNRPPLWATARLFAWLGMPTHLKNATVKATESDRQRMDRAVWGRA